MAGRLSYRGILRQRVVLAGLTLGLITLMLWFGLELYFTATRSVVPGNLKKLTEPLNPVLNVEVIDAIEEYRLVPLEEARRSAPSLAPTPEASPSATVPQSAPAFTEGEAIQ